MYLFDANVLIQSQNTFYSKDICPGFWDWLIREDLKGNLKSIREVHAEFTPDNPDLQAWLGKNESLFIFQSSESKLNQAYKKLAKWVNERNCCDSAKSKFLDKTDYHLVAHGMAENLPIITFEKPEPNSKKA